MSKDKNNDKKKVKKEKNIEVVETVVTVIKDTTSNPGPLGLLAFGMTTVLLNIHNAGLFGFGSMIIAMGIFYGGTAQVIAGIMEWKKGNTFGTVAFTSYGFFWLTLAGLKILPNIVIAGKPIVAAPENSAMVAYLIMWGIFTFALFIGTLKLNRALQVVFATLTILFFMLAIGDITGNAVIKTLTGLEGIVCGLSAIYLGFAEVLNEVYGKTLLPIGAKK